jgi:hypothetical protein
MIPLKVTMPFEWKSLDEAIESDIGYLNRRGSTNVSLVQRTPTHLSRLPAMLFSIRYENSREAIVEGYTLCIQERKGYGKCLYH